MLAGEKSSSSSKAGEDLVEDEQHIVRVAPRAQGAKHACWPKANSCGALDERFDDHRREPVRFSEETASIFAARSTGKWMAANRPVKVSTPPRLAAPVVSP